jgi:glutaminyl-peptide cyclotransferase
MAAKRRRRAGDVVAMVLLLSCACTRNPLEPSFTGWDPATLDGARALEHVRRQVDIGPRPAGSNASSQTVALIAGELATRGLAVTVDAFEDATPDGPVRFSNLYALVPGDTNRVVVLVSHHDTKVGIAGNFVGANDAGSSTGLLLELARVLHPPPPGGPAVMLAFVDGEEARYAYAGNDGLHGSRRLATILSRPLWAGRIRAVIVIDMIGDRDLTITIPRNAAPKLLRVAFTAAEAEGIRERITLYPGAMLDDHVPFLQRGIPAIDLIDFNYGSSPGRNDYWHTDADTLDKLSSESLASVGRLVVRMLNILAGQPPAVGAN